MKVYDVFRIKTRGPVVVLDSAVWPERSTGGEHEKLEAGSRLRRSSDGATWTVRGVGRMGYRRDGTYLLDDDGRDAPYAGDEVEIVEARTT